MKIKFLSFFVLCACVVLFSGCIGTEDGHSVAGVPFTADRIVSRYARPVSQLAAVTRVVLNRNGKLLLDNTVNNTFEAKVNQHSVWVKIVDIDGKTSEVIVQARGGLAGDVQTAAEISTQIGMMLVANQNQS